MCKTTKLRNQFVTFNITATELIPSRKTSPRWLQPKILSKRLQSIARAVYYDIESENSRGIDDALTRPENEEGPRSTEVGE